MKIEEFEIVINANGVSASHPEYDCLCEEVNISELRKDIHNLVDKLPNKVWTDGHREEPATKVYMVIPPSGKLSIIDNLDSLIDQINYFHSKIWSITVEDGLI